MKQVYGASFASLLLSVIAACSSPAPKDDREMDLDAFRARADEVFEGTQSCRPEKMRTLRAFLANREEDGRLSQGKDVSEALALLQGIDPAEFAPAYAELHDFAVHLARETAQDKRPTPIAKRVWEITSVAYVMKDCPLHEASRLLVLLLRSDPKPGWPKAYRRKIFDVAQKFLRAEPFDATGFVLATEVADAFAASRLVWPNLTARARVRRLAEESRTRVREVEGKEWHAYPPHVRSLMQELREALIGFKFKS